MSGNENLARERLHNILEKGLINNIMITCLCRARQTGPGAGNPEKPVLNLFQYKTQHAPEFNSQFKV
jgi:hypothetical protein